MCEDPVGREGRTREPRAVEAGASGGGGYMGRGVPCVSAGRARWLPPQAVTGGLSLCFLW